MDDNTDIRGRGKVFLSDILSYGLAMDREGTLYVSDWERDEVRRYGPKDGDRGAVVAGGHGQGDALNQLNSPGHLFIDADYSIYVSDWCNHRVMKWKRNAREGAVVAGGQGRGTTLQQLFGPSGIYVDRTGCVYVADEGNDRLMRWKKGATVGEVLVGRNEQGSPKPPLSLPASISLDVQGNLYVADYNNHRIQRFDLQ